MESQQQTQLRKLSELKKYRVADGEPDVRGWYVIGRDRERLGQVHDLVVDANLEKVRYLEIALDKDIHVGKDERHVLIPIGHARIDREDDFILVDNLDRNRVRFYPIYSGEALTREYEYSLREALHEYDDDRKQASRDKHEHAHSEEATEHSKDPVSHSPQEERLRSNREQYEEDMHSDDPLTKMRAERDIARSERDILRAELEMLKGRLRSARQALDANFYDHESFDERQFYENRKSQTYPEDSSKP